MQIEKINENQLEVILDLNDLEQHHITAHSFMCNSASSQDLCFDILSFANKEIGFELKNYKIIIESFSVPKQSSFILIVTRVPIIMTLKHYRNYKRFKCFKSLFIKFDNFEDFCMYCNSLKNDFKTQSSLYLLDGCYFLHIKFNNLKDYRKTLVFAKEFSNNIYNNNFILDENAEIIIGHSAIQNTKKYFI